MQGSRSQSSARSVFVKELFRVIANAAAIVAIICASIALNDGEWTVAKVQMAPFPGPENTPQSHLQFGLFEYKAFLFGEKDSKWRPYTNLQQTDDVKALRSTGQAVCATMVISLICICLFVLGGLVKAFVYGWNTISRRIMEGDLWDSRVEDWVMIALTFTSFISCSVAVSLWGIAGHNGTKKIEAALSSFPLPILGVTVSYGESYMCSLASGIASLVCAACMVCVMRSNAEARSRARTGVLIGGVIPSYDSFNPGDGAPLPL
mmetsp:Transcript_34664/g.83872  ORF Transcript_34664/g.83872 Transcript_34664/m.83872 type:complete len:263 (-) Transcript_34664:343-1131(-)